MPASARVGPISPRGNRSRSHAEATSYRAYRAYRALSVEARTDRPSIEAPARTVFNATRPDASALVPFRDLEAAPRWDDVANWLMGNLEFGGFGGVRAASEDALQEAAPRQGE